MEEAMETEKRDEKQPYEFLFLGQQILRLDNRMDDLQKEIRDLRQEIGKAETNLRQEIGKAETNLRQEIGGLRNLVTGVVFSTAATLIAVLGIVFMLLQPR